MGAMGGAPLLQQPSQFYGSPYNPGASMGFGGMGGIGEYMRSNLRKPTIGLPGAAAPRMPSFANYAPLMGAMRGGF
jgi:hypothetical protein